QYERHRQIGRGGARVGNQTQNIAEKHEEEGRQQERQKAFVFLADVRPRNLIPNKNDGRFEHILKNPMRGRFAGFRRPVPPAQRDKNEENRSEERRVGKERRAKWRENRSK